MQQQIGMAQFQISAKEAEFTAMVKVTFLEVPYVKIYQDFSVVVVLLWSETQSEKWRYRRRKEEFRNKEIYSEGDPMAIILVSVCLLYLLPIDVWFLLMIDPHSRLFNHSYTHSHKIYLFSLY